MLAAEGLDVNAMLTAASIDIAALDAAYARVDSEKISRLWEFAAEQSGNPAIALAQHQVVRPASFEVVGYTMMSCTNLLGAFERLIRYLLILSDALTMTLSEEQGGYRVTFDLFGGNRPVPRQRIEFILVSVISYCRWISGRESVRQLSNCRTPSRQIWRPTKTRFDASCCLTHRAAACCLPALN